MQTAYANLNNIRADCFPGNDDPSENFLDESFLAHIMSNRYVHRITTRREMAKIMTKQVPYSGTTKQQRD